VSIQTGAGLSINLPVTLFRGAGLAIPLARYVYFGSLDLKQANPVWDLGGRRHFCAGRIVSVLLAERAIV
jgi:hypothetical protein